MHALGELRRERGSGWRRAVTAYVRRMDVIEVLPQLHMFRFRIGQAFL
ncbi:hypothetical protein [Streptomyces sp. NPDC058991]